jgi:hypothetical protein
METFKFITQEDLDLQEQLNVKFKKQGNHTLNILCGVQDTTKNRTIHQRWVIWLREHFSVYLDTDLSRSEYIHFEEGDLCYSEDCYEYHEPFRLPLLTEDDLTVITNKMVLLLSEYEVEVRGIKLNVI